jgi:hypothetical protein
MGMGRTTMKIEVFEYDGEFSFEMTAETIKDAAWITRAGINGTRKVSLRSMCNKEDKFTLDGTIGKNKRWQSTIPKV